MGKKQKEELPDYTVADMDLDGMPWNTRRPWQIFPGDPSRSKKKDISRVEPETEEAQQNFEKESNPFLAEDEEPFNAKERRALVWMALKAALLIAGVFGLAGFLFILFCVNVWLK